MVAGNPSKGGTRFLSKLDDLRQQIDNLDDQLLKLINRRGLLAQKIGKEKFRQGKMTHFHVPQRERAILDRLNDQSKGPFTPSSVNSIFREIFSATLALEKPLKIAFLGPETRSVIKLRLSILVILANLIPALILNPFSQKWNSVIRIMAWCL